METESTESPVCVVVIARAPELGRVKTRLARDVGEETALEVYQSLLQHTFQVIRDWPEVEIRYTSESYCVPFFDDLPSSWRWVPQGDGDLGDRLARAAADAFGRGQWPLLIGVDCPELVREDLDHAERAMTDHDAVIGPAEDGGYWLLGLSRNLRSVFRDIPWSSQETLLETLCRMRDADATFRLLEEKTDVDTVVEWRRYAHLISPNALKL